MGKHLLVIGLVWPEPSSSAAGWRMLQLLALFKEEGYLISFASAASKSAYSVDLQGMGIQEVQIQLNDSSFDSYLEDLMPEVVLFDRFMIEEQYSWRVAQVCPNAIRVLDTEDLHFVRQARQEAFKKQGPWKDELYYSAMAKRELAAIYRSDLSLIISQVEWEILTKQFHIPAHILTLLSFHVSKDNLYSNFLDFEDRKDFVFIGNFLHEPNWRTVLEIKRLWPKIRQQIPKAEVHIYGAYPSQKVWELNKPNEGFIIKGRAEHAVETLSKYRVLLAPIPFGAGLKGKFIDALYAQTPSVTSKIGAEGMLNNRAEWQGFIVENEEEIVEKACELYLEPVVWNEQVTLGKKLLMDLLHDDWGSAFIDQLDAVRQELGAHRNLNFTGQILWSNQFLATKYMSQWIEEKNKSNDDARG
ncbi:glycosyltransferase family 4 protein [Sphingobacterium sp. HJSM2_6]|uniref:glycosyltransferase family 4 protein n=1 Tax=Sphingobacterium sp. HJSM2_6 TaxID=3366264 RepID=UPI003BC8113D